MARYSEPRRRPRSTARVELSFTSALGTGHPDLRRRRRRKTSLQTGRLRNQSVAVRIRCSFCEWGTGAIGTKMYQFSLARIRSDFEKLVAGGVSDIWLSDSNFGALREDEEKAEMIIDLRQRTGLPRTFATSWSKNHNKRVQRIVRLLHTNGLLSHYNLALQTLTPLALDLSHRSNMRANNYEPIVKQMAEEGIPIAGELIWGLPGDTLAEFEANLDHLFAVFPNINIFGYTLLPGTEFYEKREEYQIQTVPVAGYGKAKGEYVIGCHTFSRDQGEEGYFMITAYIILVRGQMLPLTTRFLALAGEVPVTPFLRTALRQLLADLAPEIADIDVTDRMAVYEQRARIYVELLRRRERTYETLRALLAEWIETHGADGTLVRHAEKVLTLDESVCPFAGPAHVATRHFSFDAARVGSALRRMDLPTDRDFDHGATVLSIDHPGHVGEVIQSPDGGEWVKGRIAEAQPAAAAGGLA